MNWLLFSDLHLTDRPRDEYRFGLFPWLAKQQKEHAVDATFLLGDITDKKDKHTSVLVNRVIDEITKLKPPLYILRGNHDGIDENNPFFRFMNCIDGIEFIVTPEFNQKLGVAFLPHCRTQQELDDACAQMPEGPRAIMCHQTFSGAQAESGTRLMGLSTSPIELLRGAATWAGDVHKPQRCGPVTYIGAPYHVRFGDDFTPRCLLVKGNKEQNLYYPAPHKWALTIRDPGEIIDNEDLKKGDQAKIVIELAREEAVEWQTYKQQVLEACADVGVSVYGCEMKLIKSKRERPRLNGGQKAKSPRDVFEGYCQREGVASNIKKAGLGLLD